MADDELPERLMAARDTGRISKALLMDAATEIRRLRFLLLDRPAEVLAGEAMDMKEVHRILDLPN